MLLEELFTEVADSLRSWQGSDNKIAAENFAAQIDELPVLDTEDATATSGAILKGETAYVDGEKVEGTMENLGTLTFTPGDSAQTIPSGYVAGGQVQPADITTLNEYKTCLALANSIDTPVDYDILDTTAADIRAGKVVYVNGEKIVGTMTEGMDTSDATATVEDMASGKTAYVNGEKITGTVETITGTFGMQASKIQEVGPSIVFEQSLTRPVLFRKNTKNTVSATRKEIADTIKLTPDMIAEGQTVLDVIGEHKGLDTSDATATVEDIVIDKTAYVDGQKLVGVNPMSKDEYNACLTLVNSVDNIEDYTDTTATAEDIREGKTAYSNGTKLTGTMIASSNGLNNDYQRLEYLESNGTQYINTEVYPVSGKHTAMVNYMMTKAVKSREQWAFGQWYYSAGWRCGGATNSYSTHTKNTSCGFTYTNGGVGTKVLGMSTNCPITSEFPMFLFAQQSAGNAEYVDASYFRIYECRIWENQNLIRDFIPCYRKSDSKPGMYDIINDVFYVNQGTGEFIIGPEVTE